MQKIRISGGLIYAILLLCLVLPISSRAEDTLQYTYNRITSEETLTDGIYVLVTSGGYAPHSYDVESGWIFPATPAFENGKLTDPKGAVWEIFWGESGVYLADTNGNCIAPRNDGAKGIACLEQEWEVYCENGQFVFSSLCEAEKSEYEEEYYGILALDADENLGFLACDEFTVSEDPEGYPCRFALYKQEFLSQPEEPDEKEQYSNPGEPEAPLGAGFYFGQLHGHSNLSDGTVDAFTLYETASDSMDFLAITDHSNSFDNADLCFIAEDAYGISESWTIGKDAALDTTSRYFVGIYGYEMAWPSQMGLGHIATFNTPGFQSWEQDGFDTYRSGLENYYACLPEEPASLSLFAHPGTYYGDFKDFAHRTTALDNRITLIDVGSDDTWYSRALDKGWHLAPVNDEDFRGEVSSGRTVVYAQSLTEEGIYDALANYRAYATQDSDLLIDYTLDGFPMGSRLKYWDVGETAEIVLELDDPSDSAIGFVEVLADGAEAIGQASVSDSSATVEFTPSSEYSYYYIRVTQPDADVAVTAPVWIDQTQYLGISGFYGDRDVPVQNRQVNLTVDFYNDEPVSFSVEEVTFYADGEEIHSICDPEEIASGEEGSFSCAYTHAGKGTVEFEVVIEGNLEGHTCMFSETVTLHYRDAATITDFLVDNTHGNTGADALDILSDLASGYDISVIPVEDSFTQEMLDDAAILLVYPPKEELSEEFIRQTADFARLGGTVILCSQAASENEIAAQQLNLLLEAMDSTMAFGEDSPEDPDSEDGAYYLSAFNSASEWCAGLNRNQTYRFASGCSVDVGDGTWLVKNSSSVALAVEILPSGGKVFAAGSPFLDDGNIEEEKNIWSEPFANRTIAQNILGAKERQLPLSAIADVRAGTPGGTYRIRGYVTAGTKNPYNRFEQTLYLQDDTGGIAIMPFVREGIAVGTALEVTGCLGEEDGNPVLDPISFRKLDYPDYKYEAEAVSAEEAADYATWGGQLLQVQGEVTARTKSGEAVSRFTVEDEDGNTIEVLIEEEICSASTGENTLSSVVKKGKTVRAIGICHLDEEGNPVLRVRNCDEILLLPARVWWDNPDTGDSTFGCFAGLLVSSLMLLILHKKKAAG